MLHSVELKYFVLLISENNSIASYRCTLKNIPAQAYIQQRRQIWRSVGTVKTSSVNLALRECVRDHMYSVRVDLTLNILLCCSILTQVLFKFRSPSCLVSPSTQSLFIAFNADNIIGQGICSWKESYIMQCAREEARWKQCTGNER